ncbi:MAG TPA: caspase family protein [Rhizomicrobium sp.]|jgi:hypothetical protein|nr:caspase family protein [Rhizomicrobium sp.]
MADRALLVGIDSYPPTPLTQLTGCVNDINDVSNFIVAKCGFDIASVRLLANERATTDAVLDRLKWLVADAAPGDRLFFHYSGHGGPFPTRNVNGNVDSVHETICPYDFDWTRAHAIIDDDLRALFDSVPDGVVFIFVADCCCSGALTRAIHPYPSRMVPLPADIAWRLRTAQAKGIAVTPIQHDRCALISGCEAGADKEAYETALNPPNGVLTYYLLQQLGLPGGLDKKLTDLIVYIDSTVKTAQYDQIPQLNGPDFVIQRGFLQK